MTNDARENRIDYVEFLVSRTDDVNAAKRFYGSVFGWTYKDWGAEYADTQSSGVTSGVTVDPSRTGRPLVVVYTTDLEGAHKRALAAGAKLTKDIFPFPGGRRFQCTDPSGNELGVWTDKDSAGNALGHS